MMRPASSAFSVSSSSATAMDADSSQIVDLSNVLLYSIDMFGEHLPSELLPFLPNKCFRPPTITSPSLVSKLLVFVAVRDLQNEELFLNYRLNPRSELPDWCVSFLSSHVYCSRIPVFRVQFPCPAFYFNPFRVCLCLSSYDCFFSCFFLSSSLRLSGYHFFLIFKSTHSPPSRSGG